jgi:hypothetical protein
MASRDVLWSETRKNITATPLRSVFLFLVSFLVSATGMLISAVDLDGILAAWNRSIAAGSTVLVVTTKDPAGLSAARCDSLNAVPSVVVAGGRGGAESKTAELYPGTAFQVDRVTGSFPSLLWTDLPPEAVLDVVSAKSLGATLNVHPGDQIQLDDPTRELFTVDAVAVSEPRVPQLQNSLVIVDPTLRTVDSCMVEASPAAVSDVESLLTGWFTSSDPVTVLRLVPPRSTDIDGQAALSGRIGTWLPAGTGLALGALATLLGWSRRQDYANYALNGASRKDLFWMFRMEFVLLYLMPLSLGSASVILWELTTPRSATWSLSMGASVLLLMLGSLVAFSIMRTYLRSLDVIRVLKGE